MKVSPLVQTLINEITQLLGIDVIPVLTSESSMLPTDVTQLVVDRYYTTIVPKYKAKLEVMGGVDGVLKNLEDTIVEHINSISSIENSGEKSRSNPKFRKNHQNTELGQAHTALRALLDQDNIGGPDPNVLHKGSTATFYNIALREFLAYYWLAASDPNMDIVEQAQKPREEVLKMSISLFIGVVAEIRRAKNVGIHEHSKLDFHSCVPGTFGRIAAASSKYNNLTALTPPPTQLIPAEIQSFILGKLMSQSTEVKAKVFSYIYKMSNWDEVDESLTAQINELITNLKTQLSEVLSHLKTQIPGLFANNAKEIADRITKIFYIEIEKLTLKKPEMLSGEYIHNILRMTVSSFQDQTFLNTLKPQTFEYRIALKTFDYNLQALSLLIQNEIYSANLLPEKLISTTYQETVKFYDKTLDGYQNTFNDLQKNFQNTLQDAKASTSVELGKLELSAVPMETEFTTNVLPTSTQNRLTEVQTNLALTKKILVDNKDIDRSNDPQAWAINLALLATLKDSDNKYVNLFETSGPILFAALKNKESTFVNAVMEELKSIIVRKPDASDKLKIGNLVDIFNGKNIASRKVLTLVQVQEQFKAIFKDFESVFGPLTVIDLSPANKEKKEAEQNYSQWKEAIKSIMSDTNFATEKEKAVRTFILLTILNNLKLPQILERDVARISKICNSYLDPLNYKNGTPFKLNENTPLNDRLRFLAGHIKCMIITLQKLSDLVNRGAIALFDSTESEYFLKAAINNKVSGPFIFRIGNRQPNYFVISAPLKSGEIVHINPQDIAKNNTSEVIEGITFNFFEVDLDIIKGVLKEYTMLQTLITAPDFTNSLKREMNEQRQLRIKNYTSQAAYRAAYDDANITVTSAINAIQQNITFFQNANGNQNTSNTNSDSNSNSSKEEINPPRPQ